MTVIQIENSPGIAVILPPPTFSDFEDWKRRKGWRMKRWNYYNDYTRQYKNAGELHSMFVNERQQKEVAI